MRIGNRNDAMLAHDAAYNDVLPNGFKRMSGGGTRVVMAKGDVVYKVQTSFESYMVGYGNLNEYRHARALRSQSDNGWIGRVYVPATSGYRVSGRDMVVAMEYVKGRAARHYEEPGTKAKADALWQLFNLGFGDMHAGNYLWYNKGVAVVDMGSERYRSTLRTFNNADTRCLYGTDYRKRMDQHRDFWWRNRDRDSTLPPSCPCDCGMVRWDA